jgi:hypothetical protein
MKKPPACRLRKSEAFIAIHGLSGILAARTPPPLAGPRIANLCRGGEGVKQNVLAPALGRASQSVTPNANPINRLRNHGDLAGRVHGLALSGHPILPPWSDSAFSARGDGQICCSILTSAIQRWPVLIAHGWEAQDPVPGSPRRSAPVQIRWDCCREHTRGARHVSLAAGASTTARGVLKM